MVAGDCRPPQNPLGIKQLFDEVGPFRVAGQVHRAAVISRKRDCVRTGTGGIDALPVDDIANVRRLRRTGKWTEVHICAVHERNSRNLSLRELTGKAASLDHGAYGECARFFGCDGLRGNGCEAATRCCANTAAGAENRAWALGRR